LRKYQWLQAELHRRDVSRDHAYQARFNGFYRVRRNPAWQRAFYGLLEQGKSSQASLLGVLLALHAATGRVEASFASKLVATIDPGQPVIDSVVLRNLGFRLPSVAEVASRIEGIVALRDRMAGAFSKYLETANGRYLAKRFKELYPEAQVTEVKMLDLVLWQTRTAA
jgi:hypothetical protein